MSADEEPKGESMAYEAGRMIAPYLVKAKWALKGLAGDKNSRIRTEREMGALLSKVYEAKVPVGRDPREDQLLEAIGARLAERLTNKTRRFRFRCDRAGIPNALAIPGGFIYVSRDLIAMCDGNAHELAFVVAHEMGHDVAGDSGKRFLTQTVINGLLNIRTRATTVLTPALRKMFGELIRQGFSEEQEYKADAFAMRLLKSAGYDPEGGIRLLERLQDMKRDDIPISEYFCNHPPLSERLERLREEAQA